MVINLISHNVDTGDAVVKLQYNGITHEDKINLKLVVPGMARLLNERNEEFSEELQIQSLEKYVEAFKRSVDRKTYQPAFR